jgi:Zn-dependent protease with chaperone function
MATTTTERVRLPGLAPNAFEHPLDRAALDVLRRTPGLDALFRKLASLHFERIVRLHYTADSLRLSPRQCPRIYDLMRDAASVLDMGEPELYLLQTPVVNAQAIGMERYTLVITSGLVDLMGERELRAVIGHELGHIKSNHMLYKTMAIFLALVSLVAARNLPFINLITQAMLYAFYDWSRKSELTADRAGLLVEQDRDVLVRTLLKLAGGAQRADTELNVEEFLKQADDYEDMDSSLLDLFYKLEMTIEQTHPFPALRAKEIHAWADSEEYRRILSGDYPRASGDSAERRCARCGAATDNPMFRFCPECGGPL